MPDLGHALAQLRERYRASAPQLVATFRGIASALASDPRSPALISSLRDAAHRVRGTAGSYGFTHASELAGVLEERARHWQAEPEAELASRVSIVNSFAEALEVAFAAA